MKVNLMCPEQQVEAREARVLLRGHGGAGQGQSLTFRQLLQADTSCFIFSCLHDQPQVDKTEAGMAEKDKGKPLASVLDNSLGWGSFMAVSSNTRYQIVNTIEERLMVRCCLYFLFDLDIV